MSAGLQTNFHERIAQLIYTFPEDANTSTGSPFWSAPKRFPQVLDFDAADAGHASFAQAAAILKAEVHGIQLPSWAFDASQVSRNPAFYCEIMGTISPRVPTPAKT